MPSTNEPDSRLKIILPDLSDKDLYKVNQVINDLYTKIDTLRIDGRFYGKSQFEDLWLNTDRDPATLQNQEVLNLGEIRKLNLLPGTSTTIINNSSGGGGGGGSNNVIVRYPPNTLYSNAISRLLSEKVGETISVMDFGASGDGSSDDAPKFNDAIQAATLAGRGKQILIPACKTGEYYKLNSKITIDNRYYLNGTVSTSGTTVTKTSGDDFPSYLGTGIYNTITIDGSDYTIASWTNATEIELTAPPAGDPLSTVAYSSLSSSYVPLAFIGEGELSLVKRGAALSAGEGLFDIKGKDIHFEKFCVDGGVTTPTPLLYADFASDPMDPLLTTNTSFWIHGPSENITFNQVTVTHTGGYSVLIDAASPSNNYDANSYDIRNTKILHCDFVQNRPHLFGSVLGSEDYGSWTGGIFLNTYGVQDASNYLSTTYNTLIEGCYFYGNTGNCIWSHLHGYDILHSDLRCLGNTYIDNGLDCIEYGGVDGGTAAGNRTRRTGYIATDPTQDVSPSNPAIPRWLAGKNATALDSSGVCRNVVYANNTVISTNGGDMDLDGFCDGQAIGNVCMTPRPTDPEYVEDLIAISGPAADGVTWSYGCQPSNTFGGIWGAVNVGITGNSFINKYGGAIRLGACRKAFVSGNNIYHPAAPGYGPIVLFNIGTGTTERTYDSVVANNAIFYNPVTAAPAITEFGAALGFPAFQPGDKNWVHQNQIVGNSYEFAKDAATSSTSGQSLSMNYAALAVQSDSFLSRQRTVATTKNFDYLLFQKVIAGTYSQTGYLLDNGLRGISGYVSTSGTAITWISGDKFDSFTNGDIININGTNRTISTHTSTSMVITASAGVHASVTFASPIYAQSGPFLNIGDGTNGSITTGNRSVIGFDDVIATNVFAADGFLSLTDTLINQENANKLDDNYGLLWYDSATKALKLSTSATLGVRNWATIGSGGGTVAGSDKWVQFNDAGSFGASINYQFDKTLQLTTITGITTTPGINVVSSYIQSAEGFYSPGTSSTTVNIPSGGVTALSLIAVRNDGSGAITISRSTATARTYDFAINSSGTLLLEDVTGATTRLSLTTAGLFTIGTTLAIDQSGNQTMTGVLTLTGTGSGVNVSGASGASINYNAIQVSGGGGMYARSFTALTYLQMGTSAGTPTVTAGDTLNNGAMYYDTVSSSIKAKIAGSFVSLGTASVAGSNTQIQFNNSGAFGASANLTWTTASQLLSVTGLTGTAGIVAITSYIQSAEGFLTASASSTAVNASNGGVTALSLIAIRNDGSGAITISRSTATARTYNLAIDSSGTLLLNDSAASAIRMSVTTAGLFNWGSAVQIDQVGNISASAVISSTGASGGINVTAQTNVNSIQTVGGVRVSSGGSANGVFQVGTTTVIDASRNGTFVGLTFGGSSALVQGSTTRISTSGSFTGTDFNASNTGVSLTFKNSNGLFSVDGNGNISGAAVFSSTGASGGFNVTAQTAVNSIQTVGGVRVSTGGSSNGVFQVGTTTVIDASRNASFLSLTTTAGNINVDSSHTFAVGGAFFGQDATGGLVCGSRTLFFKSGILYAFT